MLPRAAPRRPLRISAYLAVAMVAVVVVSAGYAVHRDFKRTVAEHAAMARDLTAVVGGHARRAIADVDVVLRQVGAMVEAGGLPVFREKAELEALDRMAARLPGGSGTLSLFGADGRLAARSRGRPSTGIAPMAPDALQAPGGEVRHIGPAEFMQGRNDAVFTVSRRLTDASGDFAGTVAATISTAYLTDFYELFRHKDTGVAVFRMEGDILARHPNIREYIGQSLADRPLFRIKLKEAPEGVFRARSPMDDIERINAYQLVEDAGLVVLVGVPWDAVTAAWRDRLWQTGAVAFLSIVIIVLAALWSNASHRRATRAQAEREAALSAKETLHQKLHHALHDHLTGLPARGLFLAQVDGLRSQCDDSTDRLAVMIVDLDGFKGVNDTYGHQRGDEVLAAAATVIHAALRSSGVSGRLGGDEFGVCVTAPADGIGQRASAIAGRIVDGVAAIGLGIGCSVGVAICPASDTVSNALRKADEALYLAKRSGKNRFAVWAARPQDEAAIPRALAR